MPQFSVRTENLLAGGALISVGTGNAVAHGMAASAGAAAGTPAAAAWSMLAERASGAVNSAESAVRDLGRALSMAGDAYGMTDASAASSLRASG